MLNFCAIMFQRGPSKTPTDWSRKKPRSCGVSVFDYFETECRKAYRQ